MAEAFIHYIRQYIPLDPFETKLLMDHIRVRQFRKNEMIFQEGCISDEIYFVIRGCVRLIYNTDGEERTAFFFTEGQFICAGESYTFQIPARESYQAIEDTELVIFDRKNIDHLLHISPKFEQIARIATENELITCQRIIASFITRTAEERYLELMQTKGDLFLRVPQQYIASFLGITPETLSRIKKRVLKLNS